MILTAPFIHEYTLTVRHKIPHATSSIESLKLFFKTDKISSYRVMSEILSKTCSQFEFGLWDTH